MQQPRETYYGAIFNRLKTLEGTAFARVSRRLHHWNDIPKEQMPYLGVSQVREQTNYSPGRTEDNHLSIVLYVYVNESDDNESPAPKLNAALDAIQALFPPDNININACTLDGLFHWVRFGEGGIETDEGTLGSLAVARIPVEMLVVG